MRFLLIFLLSFSGWATEDILSSCSTVEQSSSYRLECRLEKNRKVFNLEFVISRYRMVSSDQAKQFCGQHSMTLDSSFLYLSREQMIYLSNDLMDHLEGVNIQDRGRTFYNWSPRNKIFYARYDNDEVEEISVNGQRLYTICSDTPSGIFLDLTL